MSNYTNKYDESFFVLADEDARECNYCGQNDPEVKMTLLTFGPNEPATLVCPDCMEEEPWK